MGVEPTPSACKADDATVHYRELLLKPLKAQSPIAIINKQLTNKNISVNFYIVKIGIKY